MLKVIVGNQMDWQKNELSWFVVKILRLKKLTYVNNFKCAWDILKTMKKEIGFYAHHTGIIFCI